MTKIPTKNIDSASDKISEAQILISDAYTLLETGMTDGALYVGSDKTDLANMIGGMQCTCDDALALIKELKQEQNE